MSVRNELWTPTMLTLIDEEHDHRSASDGHSRYGAYLGQRLNRFHEYDRPDQPLPVNEFAAAAWGVATSPVMSPGYVEIRPDLRGITPTFAEDGDGSLLIDVHVPLYRQALRANRDVPSGLQDWSAERHCLSSYATFYEPSSERPALLTTTVVCLVVDGSWGLAPQEHTRGHDLVADAKRTVAALRGKS
ncbi:hypothetical protein HW130_17255 [Streptomyces sp. PKU-EA00015]|uniref:hypothetical protein n=1 Tax=Streptomyces sp. PKU-EA00015 TaxID=2748326 RepID=UPI0015A16EB3|nr:hypothetical protein [Streptomyces sp. PKU-EA00015]NWF27992.1 hypothetical protein [Streptomyces sp. PKU-EA00015]